MRLGFFPYDALSYKLAQAELDRRAAKGLTLTGVHGGYLARFEKGPALRHFVDLDINLPPKGTPERAEYFRICADAGWEHVDSVRGLLLFRSLPGTDPLPIQTDDEMEWGRLRARYGPISLWRRLRPILLLLALILTVILFSYSQADFPKTLSENRTFYELLWLFWILALSATQFLIHRIYLNRCEKADAVITPKGSFRLLFVGSQWLVAVGYLLMVCTVLLQPFLPQQHRPLYTSEEAQAYIAAQPIVASWDLGLSPEDDIYENQSSPAMTYHRYYALVYDEALPHYMESNCYDCATEWLARWTFDRRAAEIAKGDLPYGWTNLPDLEPDWSPAPILGFDQCYISNNGQLILARRGKRVLMVSCINTDLTGPEHIEAIREKLSVPPAH